MQALKPSFGHSNLIRCAVLQQAGICNWFVPPSSNSGEHSVQCPLYPRKRTCAVQLGMSALCQERTLHVLFQAGLVHAFKEFGHRPRRIGHILLDPRNGESRMHFFDPLEHRARFVHPTCLR